MGEGNIRFISGTEKALRLSARRAFGELESGSMMTPDRIILSVRALVDQSLGTRWALKAFKSNLEYVKQNGG